VAKFRDRLAKLVARLLATAALWVRIKSQKYKMGDKSNKEWATHSSPQKI
jgi:hypothetical protein